MWSGLHYWPLTTLLAFNCSQHNGDMSSTVSLPNHTFTGQAKSSKQLTSIVHILCARNWHLPFLNQQKGENKRRKYQMIKPPRKNVADSACIFHTCPKVVKWSCSNFRISKASRHEVWMFAQVSKFINPSLAEQNMPCLSKQCRSRSVGWSGSALFVIKYVNFYQKPRSSNLIGWKLEVGVAS